jgi:uncharacterized protein
VLSLRVCWIPIAGLLLTLVPAPAQPVSMRSHAFDSPRMHDRLWLDVTLPASYAASPARVYPVVFLTDGYWRRTAHADIHALSRTGAISEVIVVGIGYPNHSDFDGKRRRDLIDHPDVFLSCLQHEVIPIIEREYRTDPAHRSLWGASYGGSFVVYSISEHFVRGRLFENYLCASPVLRPPGGSGRLRDRIAALPAVSADARIRVYLAVGGDETGAFLRDHAELAQLLAGSGARWIDLTSEIIPRRDHGSVGSPALLRGLRAVFAGQPK